MIVFNLICPAGHEFEGWFQNSGEFDHQQETQEILCPACGSHEIDKAVMAPNIATKGNVSTSGGGAKRKIATMSEDLFKMAQKVRDHVEENFDYVGPDFPDEARKIHSGEEDERGIYGEASDAEIKDLIDDGVEIAPLPNVPSKKSKKKMN